MSCRVDGVENGQFSEEDYLSQTALIEGDCISLGFSEKPKFGFSTSVPLKPIGDCLIVETKFWFLTFS